MNKYGSFSLALVTWISSLVVLVKKKPNIKQKGSYKYCKIKQFSWEKNSLAIICNTYISRCCYLINIFSISEKDILPFGMTICERKMKCTISVYINIHTHTVLCLCLIRSHYNQTMRVLVCLKRGHTVLITLFYARISSLIKSIYYFFVPLRVIKLPPA